MKYFHIGAMADSFKLPVREALLKVKEVGAEGFQIYASRGEFSAENVIYIVDGVAAAVIVFRQTFVDPAAAEFARIAASRVRFHVTAVNIADLAPVEYRNKVGFYLNELSHAQKRRALIPLSRNARKIARDRLSHKAASHSVMLVGFYAFQIVYVAIRHCDAGCVARVTSGGEVG